MLEVAGIVPAMRCLWLWPFGLRCCKEPASSLQVAALSAAMSYEVHD